MLFSEMVTLNTKFYQKNYHIRIFCASPGSAINSLTLKNAF